eukprot:656694-Rhodomonas_salina.1
MQRYSQQRRQTLHPMPRPLLLLNTCARSSASKAPHETKSSHPSVVVFVVTNQAVCVRVRVDARWLQQSALEGAREGWVSKRGRERSERRPLKGREHLRPHPAPPKQTKQRAFTALQRSLEHRDSDPALQSATFRIPFENTRHRSRTPNLTASIANPKVPSAKCKPRPSQLCNPHHV